MIDCNADLDHVCDAADGDPCPSCVEWYVEQTDAYRREWRAASPAERDPEQYRADMVAAGRGHLVGGAL